MQRQSLGSPGSRLGVSKLDDASDEHVSTSRRDSSSSSSSTSSSPICITAGVVDADEIKLEKSLRSRPRGNNPERVIHLIPVLTLFCFLVLYLFSHEPSDSVLSQFGGFKKSSKKHIEFGAESSNEMDDIMGGYIGGSKAGDRIVGIRSMRNLQEITKNKEIEIPKQQPRFPNRKLGDF